MIFLLKALITFSTYSAAAFKISAKSLSTRLAIMSSSSFPDKPTTPPFDYSLLPTGNTVHGADRLKVTESVIGNKISNSGAAPQGQIFVCSNKYCTDKGSDATMASFTFLTPQTVSVQGVNCLGRCNKGPNVRILTPTGAFVEGSMVRSVEKVVELLQSHLNLNINLTSAEVLRLNYEGNVYLRSGEVDQAVDCYDKALLLGDKEQEGVLLVMRGTALLQRAYACRLRHKEVLSLAEHVLPSYEMLSTLIQALMGSSEMGLRLALDILIRIGQLYHHLDISGNWGEVKSRWPEAREGPLVSSGEELINRASFSWSLYEHSLLRALQDLLTATVLLPGFSQAWRRAADALSEVRLYRSAVEYYEVAVQLDPSMSELLLPAIERLKLLDRLVSNAEANGWPPEAILSLIEE